MGPRFRGDDDKFSRQLRGNLSCLRFANHNTSVSEDGGRLQAVSMLLRTKALASVVALALAAVFARSALFSPSHPCIATSNASVEIAALPWHADLHVAFTEDPKAATVRVQITESAETADFALVDDMDAAESGACEASPAHAVSIADTAARGAPVIYLSHDGPADYRIFVRSKSFTQRDAAALVVGAGLPGHPLVRRIEVPIAVAARSS